MTSVREVELLRVTLPLVRPFRTSFGEERDKDALLVRVRTDSAEGWGECVAGTAPRYSSEWLAGAETVLADFVVPALLAGGPVRDAADVTRRTRWVRGHRMAKAALELAVLDACLREEGVALHRHLGGVRDRVACGVSVGIARSDDDLLEQVRGYVAEGYQRVKLKIEPGRDVEPVRAVRSALPDVAVSVDANAAYTPEDAAVFHALDDMDITMIEQPFPAGALVESGALQRRLRTPICLDESVVDADAARAVIALDAGRVINIKPGRVGGLLEAIRVHDVARAAGVPVWVGGMLETGIGRAANLALATLPGFTLPGDTSASHRYFSDDLTEPFRLAPDGTMAVPGGPGIGVTPRPDRLAECVRGTRRVG